MITINNYSSKNGNSDFEYKGLSTDEKPTDGVGINSLFLELDTNTFYYFDGEGWTELGQAPSAVIDGDQSEN